jgi:dTDP-glucose pyrophosphorylase
VTEDRLACIVAASGSIRDALEAVDRGAAGIALAVDDDGRLVGLTTDGDIRRALLQGTALSDPVAPVLNEHFVALRQRDTRADALDLMVARRIDAVPVLDAAGRPVALHLLHAFLEPATRENWAVIMAGGQGSRLRPLTDAVPKPMLRVAGRPILERIVLHLVGHGFRRIFLSVSYLADVIEAHFGDGHSLGVRIEYLRESEPLGTAGALGLLPQRPDRTLIVLNGDLVTSVDVSGLIDVHEHGGFAATVGTRRYVHTVPFGCVEREGDRIVGLDEKPAITREVNTGIYALAPSVVAMVEPGQRIAMPDLIGQLLARGEPVGAYEVQDDWLDVGQRDELVRAREGGAG